MEIHNALNERASPEAPRHESTYQEYADINETQMPLRISSPRHDALHDAHAARRQHKRRLRQQVTERSRQKPYATQSLRTLERLVDHSDDLGSTRPSHWLWVQEVMPGAEIMPELTFSSQDVEVIAPSALPLSYEDQIRLSRASLLPLREQRTNMASSKPGASSLRWREIGMAQLGARTLSTKQIGQGLRDNALNDFKSWRTWERASKDVITATWSPDGRTFAMGASSNLDMSNIQYNDRCTLLFGNIEHNTIHELDDHNVDRPKPAEVPTGANSIADTYNTAESQLFTTVTSVCYNPSGTKFFSGSYDKTVKVWDLVDERPTCIQTLNHTSNVELVDCSVDSELVATAQDQSSQCIRVYDARGEQLSLQQEFSTDRVVAGRYKPTCLRFGISHFARQLLLVGFGEAKDDYLERDRNGDMCLWDVAANKAMLKLKSNSNIAFDVAWHPHKAYFAAALAPGNGVNLSYRTTKTLVRTWSPYESPNKICEFEGPAMDVNDLIFNPVQPNLISASCTDGKTYLWDHRRPNDLLHTFSHGHPIDEVDSNLVQHLGYPRARELIDTGVKLCLWGTDGCYLYTGSSDGVIKQWDPRRSTESALIRVVAKFDSGVMTGALSPDRTNMLVGLAKGSMHIMSTAPPFSHSMPRVAGTRNKDEDELIGSEAQRMAFVPAPSADGLEESDTPNRDAAEALLSSGQISLHPTLGAGRGPQYHGPYARWARTQSFSELDPDVLVNQLHPEQWMKGMEGGGKPTEHAELKQTWLLRNQREQIQQTSQDTQAQSTPQPPDLQELIQIEQSEPSGAPIGPPASAPPAIPVPRTPQHRSTPSTPWSSSRPRPEFRYPSVPMRRESTPTRAGGGNRERNREEVRRLAREAENKGDMMCLDD